MIGFGGKFGFVILSLLLGCSDNTQKSEGDSGLDQTVIDTDQPLFDAVFLDPVEDDANGFFDPMIPREVRLTLPEAEWEALLINAQDEVYIPADIAIDGNDIGEVGIRFKGSYGTLYNCFEEDTLVCPKLSLKIRFNKYDKEKRYKGLKRINLHSMHHDTSMMAEHVSYKIFREMGFPTARTGYANLIVNDTLLGVFSLVEQLDGRFTDSRFKEGDGNLYKEVQLDDTTEEWNESLRTNDDIADHTGLEAFADAMLNAADDQLVAELGKWMNVTYLMRFMAVDDAIFNGDSFTTFYCGDWGCENHNFYIYQEETERRFWLIPWDLDAAFSLENWLGAYAWNDLTVACDEWYDTPNATTSLRPSCGNPILKALAIHREQSDVYQNAVSYLLEHVFIPDQIEAEIDTLVDVLRPHVEADPDRAFSTWINAVKQFKIDLRNAHSFAKGFR